MKRSDLIEAGVPESCLPMAFQGLKKLAGGVPEPAVVVRQVVGNPSSFTEHAYFGDLAKAIVANAVETSVPEKPPIEYKSWAKDAEEGALAQIKNACELPIATYAATMADIHQGYGIPIGGVLATEGAIVPYGIGVDIACRMKISVLDIPPSSIDPKNVFGRDGDRLAAALERSTRFGVGANWGRNRQDHPVMDRDWNVTDITKNLKAIAWNQLGTSGTGNHFVEFGLLEITERDPQFGVDPGTYVALLSHSGSRGAGAQICSHYTKIAQQRLPKKYAEKFKYLAWLDMDSEPGQEYWAAMNLMGEYASANHAVIHANVAEATGAEVLGTVENHHNFAWKETHFGKDVYVHRKGATPAGAGVLGVIPGSMGTPCYVVKGKGNPDSLMSASHGAGRCMSRKKAVQTLNHAEWKGRLRQQGVRVLSAGVDEMPGVYKDITEIMAQQADLVDVIGTFTPKIVKMADDGKSED